MLFSRNQMQLPASHKRAVLQRGSRQMTCGFLPKLLGGKMMFKYLMLHLIPFNSTTTGMSSLRSLLQTCIHHLLSILYIVQYLFLSCLLYRRLHLSHRAVCHFKAQPVAHHAFSIPVVKISTGQFLFYS